MIPEELYVGVATAALLGEYTDVGEFCMNMRIVDELEASDPGEI